jgi:hypothetical protein
MTESTAIVNIDEQLAQEAANIASHLVSGVSTISTQGGRFKFPDDTRRDGPLSLVVLAAVFQNQLWNGNEMNNTPKLDGAFEYGIVCAANSDATLNKHSMAPFPSSPLNQAVGCENCPQNMWDNTTKPARKIGQCKNTFTMAVMFPDPDLDSTIYILRTSPTGTTEASRAYNRLRQLYGHPLRGCLVFDFAPTRKGADRLKTEVGSENPNYAKHFAYRDEAMRLVTMEPRWATPLGIGDAQPQPVPQAEPASSGRAQRSAAAAAKAA